MNGYYRCDTDNKGQRCRQPAKMRMTQGNNFWDLCGDHYAQGGWRGWTATPIEVATQWAPSGLAPNFPRR